MRVVSAVGLQTSPAGTWATAAPSAKSSTFFSSNISCVFQVLIRRHLQRFQLHHHFVRPFLHRFLEAAGLPCLTYALQRFGLLAQHSRQLPQHFPRSTLVATHCGSGFTLSRLRPCGSLPRLPLTYQFRLPLPPFQSPAVRHLLALIVGVARNHFPSPETVPPCHC